SHCSLQAAFEHAVAQEGFQHEQFVLKPCISGGGRHTYKMDRAVITQHEALFAELVQGEAMMLQEFQENIVSQGEYSLMVLDGQYSHAVLKRAKPGDFRVQDDFGGSVQGHGASVDQIAFAEKVVRCIPECPLYARVDIFRDNAGQWALAELEIFEPELWFRLDPGAAGLLASAIRRRFFP